MTRLPDAEWRHRPGLAALTAALGDVRLVGGAVRDGLLGLPVSDIDMATPLTPDQVIARLSAAGIKAVPTGIAHGTVTAVTESGPVEITTLRRDVATDGRHAEVAFTDDWKEDAARRDFTINALSADPRTGAVFDYFSGEADLRAGRVRFIGDAFRRIAEDHLRILRFFRFHARFGRGAPDTVGLIAARARANDLMTLSRERIAAELLKLLAGDDPGPTVEAMIAGGIFKPILPEIVSEERLKRLIARERELEVAGDPMRRLAALIGPFPSLAADIASRLRFSKSQAKRLAAACGWREAYATPEALAYTQGTDGAIDRLLLGGGAREQIDAIRGWARPRLPVSGGDLVARGLMPGPVVARTLQAIEADWIAAGFPGSEALQAIVARHLAAATL